ncbi:hypothetical protein [Streptomyces lasiicapitis]|uniref:Uncharacterized protein n=1 Tax=Streptomyces lasiicapitis TaxID=1923961 RepID=A0ABQ2MWU7_9ACTN|nr:hypothetical protein [Streptomyces lasiicapitis]GGO58914.1 hypothetical protein GCM10012286_79310 [Streptomyces lasiicapitis]
MTDTELPAHRTAVADRFLSPRDEARVQLAVQAQRLAAAATELMPVDPDAAPGALLRAALALEKAVHRMQDAAVVAERERGTNWTQLGETAGMTKQSAHRKWAQAVQVWAQLGRATTAGHIMSTPERAAWLDAYYAQTHPERADAVSAGLDAVRHPQALDSEHARRGRAAVLHARREALAQRSSILHEEFMGPADTPADRAARASSARAFAALNDEQAELYTELAAAEPALAEEHLADAARAANEADRNREHAALLDERAGA